MNVFYSQNIIGSELILSQEESNHAKNVLRLSTGAEILVTDGNGRLFTAIIKKIDAKSTIVEIKSSTIYPKARNYHLHIIIAPTKSSDRIEKINKKSIEIGVDEISFIQTERSERKHINLDRINKIAISAMKQCKSMYLPKINDQVKFEKALLELPINANCYIAHLNDSDLKYLKEEIKSIPVNRRELVVLIGPEGDFSKKEIALALSKNIIAVSLGDSVLRTETAGILTCAIINTVL